MHPAEELAKIGLFIPLCCELVYREEFLPEDPSCCLHCGPLLRKIEILQQELAGSDEQLVA